MSAVASLNTLRRRAQLLVDKVAPVGPLLARLTIGIIFLTTGWGKLHNLSGVTEFFTSLGIPAPGLNAVVVATTEFLGGISLILGLLTRFAALPLAFSMVVAIATAKWADVESFGAFIRLEEFLFLTFFVWFAAAGAGRWSLDALIVRWLDRRDAESSSSVTAGPAVGTR